MFTDLACRINVSFGSFKFSLENPWFWTGVVFVLVVLWRWWGIKKLLSFSIIIAILIFSMFKLDAVIMNRLGEEGREYTLLTKPFFIGVCAFVFLYYGFIRKEK